MYGGFQTYGLTYFEKQMLRVVVVLVLPGSFESCNVFRYRPAMGHVGYYCMSFLVMKCDVCLP